MWSNVIISFRIFSTWKTVRGSQIFLRTENRGCFAIWQAGIGQNGPHGWNCCVGSGRKHPHEKNVLCWRCVCMCVLLATSPWGLSKLWGGGVLTSDIDLFGPRLLRLMLHSLLIAPVPPSLTSIRCPSGGGIPLLPHFPSHQRVYTRDHPPTQASPVSIPAYQKIYDHLPLTLHFQSLINPPWSLPHHAC